MQRYPSKGVRSCTVLPHKGDIIHLAQTANEEFPRRPDVAASQDDQFGTIRD